MALSRIPEMAGGSLKKIDFRFSSNNLTMRSLVILSLESSFIVLSFTCLHLLFLLFFYPVVSFFLKFQGKFLARRPYDPSVVQYMDNIRDNIVEQPLIMCYYNCRIFGFFKLVHPVCDNP